MSNEPKTGHANVHAAKLAVMAKVKYVQKTRDQGGMLKYAYAKVEDLLGEIRAAMIEEGLDLTPVDVSILESEVYKSSKQADMRRVVAKVCYVLSHGASETTMNLVALGEAADSGDKAIPKAMTAALKTALRQTFMVETGELDPDAHEHKRASREGRATRESFAPQGNREGRPQPPPRQQPPQQRQAPPAKPAPQQQPAAKSEPVKPQPAKQKNDLPTIDEIEANASDLYTAAKARIRQAKSMEELDGIEKRVQEHFDAKRFTQNEVRGLCRRIADRRTQIVEGVAAGNGG